MLWCVESANMPSGITARPTMITLDNKERKCLLILSREDFLNTEGDEKHAKQYRWDKINFTTKDWHNATNPVNLSPTRQTNSQTARNETATVLRIKKEEGVDIVP